MPDQSEHALLDGFHKLKGQKCWAVVGGSGAGSHLALDFGKKIKRAQPLKNPSLAEESRKYIGEFCLFVQDCAWRLEQDGTILCTSKSDNRDAEEMMKGVSNLIGSRVKAVHALAPGFDLVVKFTKGLILRLFCDSISEDEDGDNYTVFVPGVAIIAAKGRLAIEQRT